MLSKIVPDFTYNAKQMLSVGPPLHKSSLQDSDENLKIYVCISGSSDKFSPENPYKFSQNITSAYYREAIALHIL